MEKGRRRDDDDDDQHSLRQTAQGILNLLAHFSPILLRTGSFPPLTKYEAGVVSCRFCFLGGNQTQARAR